MLLACAESTLCHPHKRMSLDRDEVHPSAAESTRAQVPSPETGTKPWWISFTNTKVVNLRLQIGIAVTNGRRMAQTCKEGGDHDQPYFALAQGVYI